MTVRAGFDAHSQSPVPGLPCRDAHITRHVGPAANLADVPDPIDTRRARLCHRPALPVHRRPPRARRPGRVRRRRAGRRRRPHPAARQGLGRRAALRAIGGARRAGRTRGARRRGAHGTALCWPSTTAPTSPAPPGADVLHLGQDDLPLLLARDIIGPGPLIGRSTHDAAQVAAAGDEAEEVDYFCVGPVLADPDQAGQARARPGPGPRRRRNRERRSRGSRSAASTPSGCPRCSTRARAGSWWCGPSPRPTTLPRPRGDAEGSAYGCGLTSSGIDADTVRSCVPAGGETRVQRQVGDLVLGHPAQFGALPVGHRVQQFGRVGDDGGVGPMRRRRRCAVTTVVRTVS